MFEIFYLCPIFENLILFLSDLFRIFVLRKYEIMNHIKNIIFDFGGVLIDLDRQACVNAFVELGMNNVNEYLADYKQGGIFSRLETGEISSGQFRDEIRKIIGKPLNDKDIDNAWMKFVLDVPSEKLNLLLKLRKKYRLFMLSNTNAIHIDNIIGPAFEKNGHKFADYFEKAYYSHEIGYAKPDREIFDFMLRDAGIKASESLFLDDAEANVKTARELGFETYKVNLEDDLVLFFEKNSYID